MSDATRAVFNGKPMTRYEVEIAREAFLRGWREWQGVEMREEDCYQAVERIFPLPKVTRPRVVKDTYNSDRKWKFVDGKLMTRTTFDSKWIDANSSDMHTPGWMPERVRMLADLLANPTEEIDE